MIGHVDEFGRALLTIAIRSAPGSNPTNLDAWVDTAFNGELVMPSRLIADAGLTPSGAVEATLADGSTVLLDTFECRLEWFGEERRIPVVANKGAFPLLGIGLLVGHRLVIDYVARTLLIE